MGVFVIVCSLVVIAALVAEARSEKGILVVPAGVWYAILTGLGLWLLVLAE